MLDTPETEKMGCLALGAMLFPTLADKFYYLPIRDVDQLRISILVAPLFAEIGLPFAMKVMYIFQVLSYDVINFLYRTL